MITAFEMCELLADSFFLGVFVVEKPQNAREHQRFGGMLEEAVLSYMAMSLSKVDYSSTASPEGLLKRPNVALP